MPQPLVGFDSFLPREDTPTVYACPHATQHRKVMRNIGKLFVQLGYKDSDDAKEQMARVR